VGGLLVRQDVTLLNIAQGGGEAAGLLKKSLVTKYEVIDIEENCTIYGG
jgi:hypothetical protein